MGKVGMKCTSCGAAIDHRDAFCSKCGALTQSGHPAGQKLGLAVAQARSELGKLSKRVIVYVRDEANRKQVIVGGALTAVLLLFATENPLSSTISGLFLGVDEVPAMTAEGLPDFEAYQDQFLSEEKEFIVSGAANVRDFPTSQGTSITHRFEGGETVIAREVRAFDPSSKWFKLSSGGYIWGGNLAGLGQSQITAPSSSGVNDPQFPSALQGRWSDRRSCTQRAQNTIEVSGSSMYINGRWYGLESPPGPLGSQTEFSVYYSGSDDIHVTILYVDISADGRAIAVKEIGDPPTALLWLRDERLLSCN